MSVIWDKVWFDLWNHRARTALTVMSIAIGVFAVGVIFGMVDQLLVGMDAAHQAIAPSHLNMILRAPVDHEIAHSLTKIEGVEDVEPLNLIFARYKTSPDAEWEAASLVMRDDYDAQLYDWLELRGGEWPTKDTLAVERQSIEGYGIDLGDEIILEMNGTDRTFPVTGVIRHPFVAPRDFGGQTYLFTDAAGMSRFGVPEGSFYQLHVRVSPYSEEYARDRAAAIKDLLAKQGIGVVLVIYQNPTEHWGRPFILGIMMVLQILAVGSLFASIILVTNTMTALITQQTDQIGIIKAIGGSSRTITRMYMVEVFAYGVMALAISLPLALITAYLASRWMLNIFNIDYNSFQHSNRAVLLQIFAALIVPAIAALWPILKGASLTVREALASYGLGGDFGSSRTDRVIEQIGGRFLPSLYANALGNMFRRKGRLILTQLVLISAGAMFLMVMTLNNSMVTSLNNELSRRNYDIRLYFLSGQRTEQAIAIAEALPAVTEAEAWYSITATVLQEGERVNDTGGLGAELFGVPIGSTMYEPRITAGRWLSPEDTGRVAVISQDTADFNDLHVGDTITIDMAERGDSDWEIIGTYIAVAPEPFTTDPIYAPETAVSNTTKQANRSNQILVKTAQSDADSTAAIMQELSDDYQVQQMYTNAFFSRTKSQDRAFAFNQYGIVINMLFGLAAVMGLVGGIGLMGSLSISVVERTKEIGVLRAIGAESGMIIGMFIMEGALQGVVSWLFAVPVAFVAARPVANALGQILMKTELDFAFSYTAVFAWLFIILIISVLSSIIPALNATRISVRESLAYA